VRIVLQKMYRHSNQSTLRTARNYAATLFIYQIPALFPLLGGASRREGRHRRTLPGSNWTIGKAGAT
jgi:hypothetical protein